MAWPYPRIVAHRGGGTLAPENTLGAMRLAAARGFRGVEFDVMLAACGTPVLIHDETLERTTSGRGRVAELRYSEIARFDAGGGEPVPRFEDAGRLCRELGLWANVEIKPAKGFERPTGTAVARMARELWRDAPLPPILSSFSIEALAAAQAAAPELPRGYLVDTVQMGWRETVQRLGCVALHCDYRRLQEKQLQEVHAAGCALLAWTVNLPEAARQLIAWGADCIVTDALERIGPDFR